MFALDHSTLTHPEMLSEIKWLKRELEKCKSSEESSLQQLNTNNHMLTAFQQSIESLTSRLEHETKLNEEKEQELARLRALTSHPTEATGNSANSTTLQRQNNYHGSYSDFSDCDNENPTHFDRKKKSQKSWKGSLTRAFSRKKKGWEEEWDPSPIRARDVFLSPEEMGNGNIFSESVKVDNGRYDDLCAGCETHQAKIEALSTEIVELKAKTKPNTNSLVNYIRDETSERQVLYRIAVLVQCHNTQYTIGSVGITELTTWRHLDDLILSCLANHLQLVDPGKQLGLRTTSVQHYTLDTVTRELVQEPPTVDVRDMRGAITISLKAGCSCDSVSYDSLLPLSFLRIAQSALKMEHIICLVGARYIGKTYTAELLGKNLLTELRAGEEVHNVVLYESDELQDQAALERFQNRLTSSTTPVVAIINDYTDTSFSADTIKLIKDSPGYKNSFVILLSEDKDREHLRNVRIVRCSAQNEPYSGLLERHYNRVLSTQPPEKRAKLKHIYNWLVSVWRHVNETLKQHVDGQCLMGPTHFMSCPTDVAQAEAWFLSLWNMTLTPYIISTVKHFLSVYGRKHACWADPVDFIKGSYPWTTSKEFCYLLQGIHSSELNFDSYRTGPLIGGSNVLSQDQIEEVVKCLKEHLRESCSSPSSTPCHSARDLSDPVPPARTTSVISSGSDEGILGMKPDQESFRSQRQRAPLQSPPKPLNGDSNVRENGYRYPENGTRYPENGTRYPENGTRYPENGTRYPENGGFQRSCAGRQSLPVNMRSRSSGEPYSNLYHPAQRPLNATPTRSAVNAYNLGKV